MKYVIIVCLIAVAGLLIFNLVNKNEGAGNSSADTAFQEVLIDSGGVSATSLVKGLEVPWELLWGPDNWIWFSEQDGKISKLNPTTGETKLLVQVPNVYRKRLGLMAMTLHPDWEQSPYLYLNHLVWNKDFDYSSGRIDSIFTRVVRYTYKNDSLVDPVVLFEYAGNSGHNGSRLAISPDKKIMLATGDIDSRNDDKNGGNAQDTATTGGKTLRLNLDGSIPDDNPIPGSPVWALGFRVPQGLVYGPHGKLYSAEHGNDEDDEINLVEKGRNYGYPYVRGACDQPYEMDFCATHNVVGPIKAWTPTVAPGALSYYPGKTIPGWENSLLLVTLKTQSIRVLKLNTEGTQVTDEKVYFEKVFGRLRSVCVSPAGDVYIGTGNRDWNPAAGFPVEGDDRIIRISKSKNSSAGKKAPSVPRVAAPVGAAAYNSYCASCHKEDGSGVPGVFPSLKGSAVAQGNKHELIRKVLLGINPPGYSTEAYEQKMSAFGFVSNAELADILTYVRKNFGNDADKIYMDDVARQRALSAEAP
ncbi:MAG TPA: PQQ-dependent sugar dehydrogenase [Flavitalea sp.]|nr:PQQ-dependent sugar dehydrogenase [Flavitalea sp.]